MKLYLKNKTNGSFIEKTKKIFIFLFAFFLTGCNINYNVLVDAEKHVEEKIEMFVRNKDVTLYDKDVTGYLINKINKYKRMEEYQPYQFYRKTGEESSSITLTRKFKSLKEYSKSPILGNVYEFVVVEEDDNSISFKTTGDFYKVNIYGDYVDTVAFIEKITIKFKFYNNIIESNADNFDKKSNTLTWTIDVNDDEKHLYFRIGNDKRYDIILLDKLFKNINWIITVIGAIGIICVLLLLCLKFYKISKRNNEL